MLRRRLPQNSSALPRVASRNSIRNLLLELLLHRVPGFLASSTAIFQKSIATWFFDQLLTA
jgi:hypothetical protein